MHPEAMRVPAPAAAIRPDFQQILAQVRGLRSQIQSRALEVGPYWPLGMVFGIRGYRADLEGFPKVPVPVYWNISRH